MTQLFGGGENSIERGFNEDKKAKIVRRTSIPIL